MSILPSVHSHVPKVNSKIYSWTVAAWLNTLDSLISCLYLRPCCSCNPLYTRLAWMKYWPVNIVLVSSAWAICTTCSPPHLYTHTTHPPLNNVTLMPFIFALNGQCTLCLYIEHVLWNVDSRLSFVAWMKRSFLIILTSCKVSAMWNLILKWYIKFPCWLSHGGENVVSKSTCPQLLITLGLHANILAYAVLSDSS